MSTLDHGAIGGGRSGLSTRSGMPERGVSETAQDPSYQVTMTRSSMSLKADHSNECLELREWISEETLWRSSEISEPVALPGSLK